MLTSAPAMWLWMSTPPAMMVWPVALIVWALGLTFLTILLSFMAMSIFSQLILFWGSITKPFLIRISVMLVTFFCAPLLL